MKFKCLFGFHSWLGWSPTFSKSVPAEIVSSIRQINQCRSCGKLKIRDAKLKGQQ